MAQTASLQLIRGNLNTTKLISKVATLDTAAQATTHIKSADSTAFAITDDDNTAGLFVIDTSVSGERIDVNVDTLRLEIMMHLR